MPLEGKDVRTGNLSQQDCPARNHSTGSIAARTTLQLLDGLTKLRQNPAETTFVTASELMRRDSLSTDDEPQFDAVLKAYGRLLREAVVRHCPKDLGIQFADVEQEARLRLWRALQSERVITDLASYIYRIAVNTAIDALRQVKARREEQLRLAETGEGRVESPAINPDQSPDRLAERQRLWREIEAGLASISENRRRAVEFHLQGLSSQEIADLLAWSEPKARNLIYRGLRELRERLSAKGIECEID